MRAEGVGELIAKARKAEGLTQAELARRIGTTQSAIARLERGQGNPTVATVERALRASGFTLQPQAKAFKDEVDESLIRAGLKMTPAQRLRNHGASRRSMVDLVRKARPVTTGS
ncbi:MAG: helix-turn-helix domain-containing protein [Solirubrobacterales bacterium]